MYQTYSSSSSVSRKREKYELNYLRTYVFSDYLFPQPQNLRIHSDGRKTNYTVLDPYGLKSKTKISQNLKTKVQDPSKSSLDYTCSRHQR